VPTTSSRRPVPSRSVAETEDAIRAARSIGALARDDRVGNASSDCSAANSTQASPSSTRRSRSRRVRRAEAGALAAASGPAAAVGRREATSRWLAAQGTSSTPISSPSTDRVHLIRLHHHRDQRRYP
jgi:hypothetical protein